MYNADIVMILLMSFMSSTIRDYIVIDCLLFFFCLSLCFC